MSHTAIFFADPQCRQLLQAASTAAERMVLVSRFRAHATLLLAEATARVPVEKQTIIDAYRAQGKELKWMLNDNEDAIRFCLTLPANNPTAIESGAAVLLRGCVAADEIGDVPEFRALRTGANQLRANRANGAKSGKLSAKSRASIAKRHQFLAENGDKYGATKLLAREHKVSRTTIQKIVKSHKKNAVEK